MNILNDPKFRIKRQLAYLDREMPRALEDLIIEQMQNGYEPHERQIDIINKKQALRIELAGLE